jgi:aquaporin Z
MALGKRLFAEFIGTFWLVFGGCGSAVFAAKMLDSGSVGEAGNFGFNLGIGLVGVSLAFGLTVVTMAYAVGGVSGGHFNPAVTIGLATAKRFPWSEVIAYIITQIVAAIAAAAVLASILLGKEGVAVTGAFASNGYGMNSPGHFSLASCFIAEFVLTLFFLLVILGSTDKLAPKGFAPLAIGLALTLIHLISIPITNTSVNPARSIGPALLSSEAWPKEQLWLFLLAPVLGAIVAGLIYQKNEEPAS